MQGVSSNVEYSYNSCCLIKGADTYAPLLYWSRIGIEHYRVGCMLWAVVILKGEPLP